MREALCNSTHVFAFVQSVRRRRMLAENIYVLTDVWTCPSRGFSKPCINRCRNIVIWPQGLVVSTREVLRIRAQVTHNKRNHPCGCAFRAESLMEPSCSFHQTKASDGLTFQIEQTLPHEGQPQPPGTMKHFIYSSLERHLHLRMFIVFPTQHNRTVEIALDDHVHVYSFGVQR